MLIIKNELDLKVLLTCCLIYGNVIRAYNGTKESLCAEKEVHITFI